MSEQQPLWNNAGAQWAKKPGLVKRVNDTLNEIDLKLRQAVDSLAKAVLCEPAAPSAKRETCLL